MLELILLSAADADLQSLYEVQENLRAGRGAAFFLKLDITLGRLRSFPESGVCFDGDVRRLLFPGTSLGIFYKIEGRRVMVRRILDLRQDPEVIRRMVR